MTSLTQMTVPFYSAELYLVEHNGQPYTPMRPIVENMGLAWQTQHRKLTQGCNQNGDTLNRWGVSIIETPTLSGIQEMLCIPLRKLFGWLMTISPNKVKPEIRETVIKYQNECDDVLWDYWTKGQAINKRHAISPEQQALLHEIVARRSNGERKIYAEMWSRHNRHFKIAKYSQLLSVHFSEAVHYLETMDIKSTKKVEVHADLTVFEKLSNEVVSKVTDYIWSLNREIRRLKGVAPSLPSFDEKTMAQAVINQQMQGKRMFLTFNPVSNMPEISLVEDDLLMVRRNEIENLLNDPDKVPQDRIPNIIQSAAKRLK